MFTPSRKTIVMTFILAALALFAAACTAAPTLQGENGATAVDRGGITVVGQGQAFGQPDQANVHVGVDTFAPTVNEATSQNEATVQNIMAALSEQGIAAEDIQTSNYSLWAEQRYNEGGPGEIVGYRVSNQVNVTIRNIDNVGAVLAAVTEAGANSIHGVYFSVANPAALEAEAREQAISNARERAESLANLSGVGLGNVVVISEIIGQSPPMPFGRGMDMVEAAAPSISPGQLSYQVQVQVTFAIR